MTDTVKIRVNVSAGEIELQGSKEFVEKHINNIEHLFGIISNATEGLQSPITEQIPRTNEKEAHSEGESVKPPSRQSLPDNLRDWIIKRLPEDMTETDIALAAGYFIQEHSEDDRFKTSEVTNQLKDIGIKLSNTSHSLSGQEDKGHIFPDGKDGGQKQWRVAREGEEYLKGLAKSSS